MHSSKCDKFIRKIQLRKSQTSQSLLKQMGLESIAWFSLSILINRLTTHWVKLTPKSTKKITKNVQCFQLNRNVFLLQTILKLESSQSPHTSAKAMLFTRWQHHLRLCSSFPYAPLKAMVTKISKWSRIQDSFWITPKIESLVVCAIPDVPSKFQKYLSKTFWVILLTLRQTDKQSPKNITSLVEITNKKPNKHGTCTEAELFAMLLQKNTQMATNQSSVLYNFFTLMTK